MANLIATIDTDRSKCRTHLVAPSRKTTARSRWGQVHRLGDNHVTAGVADWDREVCITEHEDHSLVLSIRDAKTGGTTVSAVFIDATELGWFLVHTTLTRPVPAAKKTRRGKRHRNRLSGNTPEFKTTGDIEGSQGRSA